MKTEKTSPTQQPTSLCRNCMRELALDYFYLNKATQRPDKYCKECRKSLSRHRYNSEKCAQETAVEEISYPIITQIENREMRIQLILHALQVVRQSIERKRVKTRLEEDSSNL